MLTHSNQEFVYDTAHVSESGEEQEDRPKKDYSRGRSYRAMRRRSRKRSSYAGCGMAGRRNKRFSW